MAMAVSEMSPTATAAYTGKHTIDGLSVDGETELIAQPARQLGEDIEAHCLPKLFRNRLGPLLVGDRVGGGDFLEAGNGVTGVASGHRPFVCGKTENFINQRL